MTTKAQPKLAQASEFLGKTSRELKALSLASPEKVPAIRAYATEKLNSLLSRDCQNAWKINEWQSLATGVAPKTRVKPKAPVTAKALTKAEILAQLQALTAALDTAV